MDKERPHQGWVRLLVTLTAILTIIAIFSTWVDRQVYDSNEWGQTSVELLQDPTVRTAVAEYAVEELYQNVDVAKELENGLDKIGVDAPTMITNIVANYGRQVIERIAAEALATTPVQDLWEKANETANQALVKVLDDKGDVVSTGEGHVQLELHPLILEIASKIGLEKQVRDRLPESVGNVSILESSDLATAQRITRLIHGLALVASLLALVTLGLAVWLARGYRWLAMIWVGSALLVAAAVVLIVRPVAGDLVVNSLADSGVRPAAGAAWDIATRLLGSSAWTIVWCSVGFFFLSWLASPIRSAERSREFLAAPFRQVPAVVASVFAVVALIFLLTGVDEPRGFVIRLAITILAAIGLVAARHHLVREFPDADLQMLTQLKNRTADSAARFGSRTADSARRAWSGSREGAGRILDRFGGEDGEDGDETEVLATDDDREPAVTVPEPTGRPAAGEPAGPAAPEAPTRTLVRDDTERFELLERLGRLRESGVLSEDEFNVEKTRILDLGGGSD